MSSVTYTYFRTHLAEVCDHVERTQAPVRIRRRGRKVLVLLPASELASLVETVHLLRSPRNASRLLAAIDRSKRHGAARETASGQRSSPARALRGLRAALLSVAPAAELGRYTATVIQWPSSR